MAHRRQWLALALVLLSLGGMAFGYAGVRAGANLLLLAKAVVILRFTDREIVTVTPKVLIQRAGTAEGPFTAFLAERGWQFKDRLGAGIIYERAGARLFVHARFTRGYHLYELDRAL